MSMRALLHASELLTGEGIRRKDGRKIREADLGRIPDGALVYSDKKIEWVGETSALPKKYLRVKKKDLKNRYALVPGFVDCHNHLIFSGNRAPEFAERCGGATYQEIASQGGGINATVRATRKASLSELEKLAIQRLKEIKSYGVRTLEIKSGYGLDWKTERKILEIIPRLREKFPQLTLTATFLGAHDFPKERNSAAYFSEVLNEMLPAVARLKLADSCDIFVDEGFYSVTQARTLLTRAKKLGLKIKVHADELKNTESASLAVKLGALSADHLLKVSEAGIRALARSQTVAVLLPGTAFYLKAPRLPHASSLKEAHALQLPLILIQGRALRLIFRRL